ncbi:MAG TPA: prolyl oligopeptidase family serine peptidase, partial [Anaerolineae bacterium]|nr:prolyl oligopeptidase family serine peptidase [Anaerolineae bacterium]
MVLVLVVLAVILLIPFVFKGEARAALVGPTLSEIEYTEVSFNNGDLQLAGILMLPEGEGPFPVAVIIHGSGTSRRDNKWYLTVTKHLQDNGIAVMLPDKRGSEESGGDWRGASFDDLAGDTLSAISYIKNQDHFAFSTIGVIGMSQGGWIAPLVATKSDDVSFVVSMSGAGVTTDEQLLFEESNSITAMGTYPFVARLIAPLTTRNIQRMDFWRPIAGFDPLPYWERVESRCFAAFGGDDQNVPVDESVTRLQALEKEILIKVYPDGG